MCSSDLSRGLGRTVAALREQGIEVWVLRQVPEPETNAAWNLAVGQTLGLKPRQGVSRAVYDTRNAFVDQAVRDAGIDPDHYLDLGTTFFNAEGYCRDHDSDGIYYMDDNHVSKYGVATLIAPQLRELLGRIAKNCAETQAKPAD